MGKSANLIRMIVKLKVSHNPKCLCLLHLRVVLHSGDMFIQQAEPKDRVGCWMLGAFFGLQV